MSVHASVLGLTAVAAGMVVATDFKDKKPTGEILRPLVGGALLAGLLMFLADFWPEIALMLAGLVCITSVALNGANFFQWVGSLVK